MSWASSAVSRPSMPMHAATKPEIPAPTIGPGTDTVHNTHGAPSRTELVLALRRNDTFCRNHICNRPFGRVRAWICRSRIYVPSTASSRETTTHFPIKYSTGVNDDGAPERPRSTPPNAEGDLGSRGPRTTRHRRRERLARGEEVVQLVRQRGSADQPSPEIAQDCRSKRVVQHMCQIDDEYCFHRCGSGHVMLYVAAARAQSPGWAWS